MIEWFEDLSVGMRFRSETVQISEDDIKQFATKFDPQPFHLDDEAAKKNNFQGFSSIGMAHRRLSNEPCGTNSPVWPASPNRPGS
jgi:acyl dehydratase